MTRLIKGQEFFNYDLAIPRLLRLTGNRFRPGGATYLNRQEVQEDFGLPMFEFPE